MANKDFTYCYGKGCVLRPQCKRHTDGLRITGRHDDRNKYSWWMDSCDLESREGFVANT